MPCRVTRAFLWHHHHHHRSERPRNADRGGKERRKKMRDIKAPLHKGRWMISIAIIASIERLILFLTLLFRLALLLDQFYNRRGHIFCLNDQFEANSENDFLRQEAERQALKQSGLALCIMNSCSFLRSSTHIHFQSTCREQRQARRGEPDSLIGILLFRQ